MSDEFGHWPAAGAAHYRRLDDLLSAPAESLEKVNMALASQLIGIVTLKVSVDITDLLAYARRNSAVSGIQRVVIETIRQFCAEHGVENIDVLAFDKTRGAFKRASAAFFADDSAYDQAAFCAYFGLTPEASKDDFGAPWSPGGGHSLLSHVNTRYRDPVKRRFHYWRLKLLNRLSQGGTFEKRGVVERSQTASSCRRNAEWRDANFNADDRVLIMGATWGLSGHSEALLRAKAKQPFKVFHLVHDLIPLVTPEHVDSGTPAQFEKFIQGVFRHADTIIANSQATAEDIARYARLAGLPSPEIVTTPLAHQFFPPEIAPDAQGHIRLFNDRDFRFPQHATARICNATIEPYALVVGTIDSRKNIARLLRAWERLIAKNGPKTPTLILAGKPGAFSDDVWRMLHASGNLMGKVRYIARPDDAELAFLYANCQFSICISYYEGWGLPIGESMWLGRPVVASNSSSMPEVGGDLVDYCDPYDDLEIETVLSRLCFDAAHREQRAKALTRTKLRSWNEVGAQLWRTIQA
jgi:glycosyltransferase involved in cell wall biosynthesis